MASYKVVSSSPTFGKISKESITLLQENDCEVTILKSDEINDREKFASSLKDADAFIVGIEKVDDQLLANAKKLKIIAKHGIGMDNINMELTERKGIIVKNVPNASTNAVADYTIGLLIASARHIPQTVAEIKNNEWHKRAGLGFSGKTLGVIGTGRIGQAVIQRANGFNMNIIAYDKFQNQESAEALGFTYKDLEEIYRQSDYIAVHTDLNLETRHLLNLTAFKKMKSNVIIVNTARGGIINEEDLLMALDENLIAGAALDVFEHEPKFNKELMKHERFIASSHTAAYTNDSLEFMGIETAKNVLRVLLPEEQ
ncbi:phosphoglycerate dehydrogenase [Planococcus halocryophilus]|uniref:phosphoglycerate dehydrogenase n=1 Tax=Planococcus halocryophilus TaxID=1215089 RepID=UPI001F0D72AC|nr:phosphoglycerate dehydrogenase [Planococcus halocryophilus]MCH4827557.1 phosphoglycerate dehydrogenase [Planococcus halocryophilus]